MKKHILYLVFMSSILLAIACDSSRRTYIAARDGPSCVKCVPCPPPDTVFVDCKCWPPGHCKDKPGKPVGEITVDSLK